MTEPEKSCATCPAMIPTNEVSGYFLKNTGTPMCGIYGKPLSKVGASRAQTTQIMKDMASTCPSHGSHKPHQPNWDRVKMEIVFPEAEALIPQSDADKAMASSIKTCGTCKWYVRDDAVLKDLGFGMGLCRAHGKLVPPIQQRVYPINCDQKAIGEQNTDLSNLTFLPVYENAFFDPNDALQVFERSQANAGKSDPTEYETDEPVSAEAEASGIRAWRKIVDPVTNNSVLLPIFRRDFFSAEQQNKIPTTGSDEHPEDYIDHGQYVYKVAVLWRHLDETPALWGRAGTGKSELFRHMAWLMQLPFERFSITGSTELDDLAGKMHYTEGRGTHFEDGRLVKAWNSPSVTLVDEPNTGPPDVWQFLRPLIDNSKQLVLDMDNGRHVKRDDNCYLGMAMNPAWDMLNVGTNMLGDADANRLMHLQVDLPPARLEERIIKDRCNHDGWKIPDEKLKMVMNIAADIRSACTTGTLPISWAIRPQLKVARALRWFDTMTAYRMASADYLEPNQQHVLLELVSAHIPPDESVDSVEPDDPSNLVPF